MCLHYVVSCPVLTALRLVQCARLNSVMPPPSDRLNSLARAAAADSPKQQLSRHSLLSCGGQPARSPCRTLQDISAFPVQTCHSHGYRRHITCGLQPSYQYIEFDSKQLVLARSTAGLLLPLPADSVLLLDITTRSNGSWRATCQS